MTTETKKTHVMAEALQAANPTSDVVVIKTFKAKNKFEYVTKGHAKHELAKSTFVPILKSVSKNMDRKLNLTPEIIKCNEKRRTQFKAEARRMKLEPQSASSSFDTRLRPFEECPTLREDTIEFLHYCIKYVETGVKPDLNVSQEFRDLVRKVSSLSYIPAGFFSDYYCITDEIWCYYYVLRQVLPSSSELCGMLFDIVSSTAEYCDYFINLSEEDNATYRLTFARSRLRSLAAYLRVSTLVPQSSRKLFEGDIAVASTKDTERKSLFSIMHEVYSDYSDGKLQSTISSISDVLDRVERAVHKFPSEEVSSLLSEIRCFVDSEKKREEQKESSPYLTAGVVIFIATSVMALKYKKAVFMIFAIASGSFVLSQIDFVGLGKKYNFLTICYNGVTRMIQKFLEPEGLKPQASDEDIKEASDCLSMLYSFFLLSTVKQENMTESIYKKITFFDKFSNNLSTMIKIIVGIAEKILNTVLDYVSPQDVEANRIRWITSSNTEVEAFMTKAQDLIDRYNRHTLVYSRYNYELVNEVRNEGNKLSQEHSKFNRRHALPNIFLSVMKGLNEIHKKYSHFDYNGTGLRPEPALINLIGRAGIGKSMVSRQITNYVLYKLLVMDGMREEDKETFVKDATQYIFFRNPGCETWDTYNAQTKVCVWDDIFQYVDFLGSKICEPMEVVRCKNMEPHALPMAFEGKNETFFGALVMVLNTNDTVPKIEQIRCAEALMRRLNTGSYICYPKDEHCTPETRTAALDKRLLDFSTVPVDENDRPLVTLEQHYFQRIKYNADGSQITYVGGPVEGVDVIAQIEADVIENKARYDQQMKELKRMRELSVYDVEHNLSILSHRHEPRSDLKPQSMMNVGFNTTDEFEEYTRKYKVFEDDCLPDEEDAISPLDEFGPAQVDAMNDFAKKVKANFTTNGFGSFYYALELSYKTYNKFDQEHLSNVTPTEVFMAYYVRYGDKFIDVYQAHDYDIQSEFLRQVAIDCIQDNFRFTNRFHQTLPPSRTAFGALQCKAKWSFYCKDFFENCKSWVYQLWNWVKTFVVNNPTLCMIIAAAPIVQYAIEKIDCLWVLNWKGYTKKHDYVNWKRKLPWYDTYLKYFGEGYLPKGYEIAPGVYLTRRYLLSEIYADDLDGELPEGSPLRNAAVTPQLSEKIFDDIKRNIENSVNEKDLKLNCMELAMMLSREELTPVEYADAIYELVDEWETKHGKSPQSVNIKPRGKRNAKTFNAAPKEKTSNLVAQSARGLDFNGNLIMDKVINNNSYALRLPLDRYGKYHDCGSILFLMDKFAFIPEHYLSSIKRDLDQFGDVYGDLPCSLVQNGSANKEIIHTTTARKFYKLLEDAQRVDKIDDGLVMRVDPTIFDIPIGTRPNILHFVSTYTQYCQLTHNAAGTLFLVKPGEENSIIMNEITKLGSSKVNLAPGIEVDATITPIYKDTSGKEYVMRHGFEYRGKTFDGDCGAILTLEKPRLGCVRIFGIHVTGDKITGYGNSQAIFRDELMEAIGKFKDPFVVDQTLNTTRPQLMTQIADGQFSPIEILETPVPMNLQSTIVKSPLYGCLFPAQEKPAPLKKEMFQGVLTDPHDHNLKKFCKAKVLIEENIIHDVCDQILIDLEKLSDIHVERRPLTIEEAVLGEDHFELGSIPRDTSVGYPEVLSPRPGLPKRTRFFGKEEDYDLVETEFPRLRLQVEEYVDNCKKKIRQPDIFAIDNLKDETISIKKVDEKFKSRVFNAFSVLKQLIDKMYFGAFSAWLRKNRINNMNAVGTNPYSKEWDTMAHKLMQFGNKDTENINDVDYACFDGSQNARILWNLCVRIICQWFNLGEEYNTILKMLFLDVADSYHIRGNRVYQWNGAMTSGAFLTIILNFLYNLFAFYYAWYKLHNFDRNCLREFKHHVFPQIVGDDNTFCTSQIYIDKFTLQYIVDAIKDIGLTATSAAKDGNIGPYKRIDQVTFLKRRWRYCEITRRYVAPIDLYSILETLYWVKNKDEMYSTTCSNVDLIFKELSLHGEEVFNEWEPKITYHSCVRLNYISDFRVFRFALAAVTDMDIFM